MTKHCIYSGLFEDLISDLDDAYDNYMLLVNHNGVCHVYEPDEIDYSLLSYGEYKVKQYTLNITSKGIIVDVDI